MAAPASAEPIMSPLGVRILTALVFGALALAADWAGGAPFILFILLLLAGLLWEWTPLALGPTGFGDRAYRAAAPPLLLGLMIFASSSASLGETRVSPAILATALPVIALLAASGRDGKGLAGRHGWRHLAWLLWFGPAVLGALWLRQEFGPLALAWCVAVICAGDIGAFFVGRLVRGPKLAPRISPGKTWSGFAGGLAASAIVGAATAAPLMATAPAARHGALALVMAGAGVVGDLAQSALKRRAGVKDSGDLLPGHGGLFDRLDSVLFALPVFAVAVAAFGWPL